jgi:UDP-2,4-diacetamido-2,4,6-trideoxy-beta-L-altropyranose hydrolase
MTNTAVFRCDATLSIGVGHLVRSHALAEVLNEQGWQCLFACVEGSSEMAPFLSIPACNRIDLSDDGTSDIEAIRQALPQGCDALIVDHYGLDAGFEAALGDWARCIIVIDDLANRPHDCDLLIDPTPGRSEEIYRDLMAGEAALFLGPRYALLRSQFTQEHVRRQARARGGRKAERLLLAFGGADSRSLTSPILDALSTRLPEVDIEVLVGPRARGGDSVTARAAASHGRITAHVGQPDVASLMLRADLAVGACGGTSWERCATGLPSVAIITADNQRCVAEELDAAGAARVLGWVEDVALDEIAEAVDILAHAPERLAQMSHRAFELCDGMGNAHVARWLNNR